MLGRYHGFRGITANHHCHCYKTIFILLKFDALFCISYCYWSGPTAERLGLLLFNQFTYTAWRQIWRTCRQIVAVPRSIHQHSNCQRIKASQVLICDDRKKHLGSCRYNRGCQPGFNVKEVGNKITVMRVQSIQMFGHSQLNQTTLSSNVNPVYSGTQKFRCFQRCPCTRLVKPFPRRREIDLQVLI